MPREMSLKQYRTMDLLFFTAAACVCEALIVLAATRWFPQEPYTLSITPAITAIVMVRWGAFAAVPAVFGALALCIASGAQIPQLAVYCAGNLPALLLLVWLRRATWRKLCGNVLITMLYGWMTALLMQIGRACVALALGYGPGAALGFITTDVLSSLFAVLLVWICRRLDGMLEAQTDYIRRIQDEMSKAGGTDV